MKVAPTTLVLGGRKRYQSFDAACQQARLGVGVPVAGGAVAGVFVPASATADLPVAHEIVGWLRADGHDVFLDRDATTGIRVGEQWRRRSTTSYTGWTRSSAW